MRDINRIEPFCAKLAEYWKLVPDWRFGQLIMNLPYKRDPFLLEEDEFINLLDEYFTSLNLRKDE